MGLSARLVVLLAVACGATVANLYYAQPLLDTIARALRRLLRHGGPARDRDPGRLRRRAAADRPARGPAAAPQARLAAAGDRRRRAGRGVRPRRPSACSRPRSRASACRASRAQILVPFASSLAAEEERGRVVGRVMSGLLLGILLARTVAGFAAELGGWRLIYGLAAAAMLMLALVLRRALPVVEPPERHGLRAAAGARSASSIREEPVLRRRMAFGFLSMVTFSGMWTSIAFLLAGPQYGYSEAVIGLFSLAGLAGAAIASVRRARWPTAATCSPAPAPGGGGRARRLGAARARRDSLAALIVGHRRARPGHPGDADPQPERDLPAAARRRAAGSTRPT